MPIEPLSPELALVDPELAARARAALPNRPHRVAARRPVAAVSAPGSASEHRHGYPFWARVTAALWLVVLGILIGGAAIPHAQDRPRVLGPGEEVCEIPAQPERPAASPGVPGESR